MQDTIFAFATATGRSALSVVRVSGPACDNIIKLMVGRALEPRKATIANIKHPADGSLIDRGLLLWFPGPASFSGEDCLELHLHGGRAVRLAALDALSTISGVRIASAGEFTRRAFLNGKSDLTQVEGLADLLEAQTDLQRRQALAQSNGALFQRASNWKQTLLQAVALMEVMLDFSDEGDVPENSNLAVDRLLAQLQQGLENELDGADGKELIRDGVAIAVIGPPNSGKSSLFNCLAKRDAAIVSDTPGTTRDVLEITLDISGYLVKIQDTAGIRATDDEIETLGIARAIKAAQSADVILYLRDKGIAQAHIENMEFDKFRIVVNTKSDLIEKPDPGLGIWVSNVTGAGFGDLLNCIESFCQSLSVGTDSVVTNARQKACITDASARIAGVRRQLGIEDPEIVCEELRLAGDALSSLTGHIGIEEVLGEIFSRFCIGK